MITGLKTNPHAIERLEGYRKALSEAAITYDPKLVLEGDFSYWSGLNASAQFANMDPPPTAIFCMNDQMAIGAMKGFKERGMRIPQDISITGFDDLEVSRYLDPPLTTVAQPAEKIGEKSAELLFQLIDKLDPSQTEYVLPIEFVLRGSTAAPRK